MIRQLLSLAMVLALLVGCSTGDLSGETDIEQGLEPVVEEDFIDVSIDLENNMIQFSVDKESEPSYHYKIFYNDGEYKEYTKADIDWGILYDYSYKDVTKVRIDAFVKQGEPEPFYSKEFLIAIVPPEDELDSVDIDIYYASRYDVNLSDLEKYKENLVSVSLVGSGMKGDMKALGKLTNLEKLYLQGCENVVGSTNELGGLTHLNDVQIIECNNIVAE